MVDGRPFVVSRQIGDINNDGIPDNVYLTGIKTTNRPFTEEITLVIRDGRTNMITEIPLQTNSGYNPTLYLADFTGDGTSEILISITSGSSGGLIYYYIYSFTNNIPKLLFDYEIFNHSYQYEVCYRNDYKVEVSNITNGIKYLLDISDKNSDYLNDLYFSNGILKQQVQGFISPLSGLYPIDYNANRVYSLLAYQRISGRYAADTLGYLQTELKWNHSTFVLDDQYVAINGIKT